MKSQSYTNLLIPSLVFSPPKKKKKKRERSKLPLYDWKSTHRFIMIWRSLPGTLTTINCLYLLFTETFMVLDCSSREGGESLNIILYFNRSHSYREISFPEDDSQGNISDYGATSMKIFIIKRYQPVSISLLFISSYIL